ncbi:hypothetical protein LINGRAHAP2_LOCUS17952, partial [Linum grandiflorum]
RHTFSSGIQDPEEIQDYILKGIELEYRIGTPGGEDGKCYAAKVDVGKSHFTVHGYFVCDGGLNLPCLDCFNQAVSDLLQ